MPRGGARVGSGRKPKSEAERWLEGKSRRKPGQAGAGASIPPPAVVAPPDGLDVATRAVWASLAPHATEARTLTAGTAAAFGDLCESIVMRRRMLAEIARDGLAPDGDAHALLSHQRGMLQRIEAAMLRFRLAPMGKPLEAEAPAAADEWAEFDEPRTEH